MTQIVSTPPPAPSPGPYRTGITDVREQYRALVHRLTSHQPATPICVGLTSAARGEGVSTVAANLGRAAAELLENPVLVIDTNFPNSRRPPAAEGRSEVGWADALVNASRLADCIHPATPNLATMGPGSVNGQHVPLDQHAADSLIATLKRSFSLVVLDLPIVGDLRDAAPLIPSLEGVLLVVEAERLRRQVVVSNKRRLEQIGANVLGVVFNKRQWHVPAWLYQRI